MLMCRADPTQKQAIGTGVLYNHLTINDLQGVAAPTPPKNGPSARAYYITTRLSMSYKEGPRRPPSGDTAGRASTRNRGDAYHYQQPVTSKPRRGCGHGRHSRPWLCEWEGGHSPPGMSEANLPWPHLRPGALKLPRSSYAYPNTAGYQAKNASKSFDIL